VRIVGAIFGQSPATDFAGGVNCLDGSSVLRVGDYRMEVSRRVDLPVVQTAQPSNVVGVSTEKRPSENKKKLIRQS
jgi:hypothetical protein